MSRNLFPLLILALLFIVLCIMTAGCSTPVAPQPETGTIHVSSVPSGAEIYVDDAYRGNTPVGITSLPAGRHTVEIRMRGYESVSYPVTVVNGSRESITAMLVSTEVTLPVTIATTATPSDDLPEIHVDGYWSYPQGRSGTTNPVALIVHTEAFNVGSADAREVTVSANFYYGGRMICWNTLYLGTLAAGGHEGKDTMVSCSLPSGLNSPELEVRFENIRVTQ